MHLSLSETSAKNWSFHHGHSLAGRNLESGTMAPRPHTATLSDQAILARWLCLQRVTFTFRKMSKPIASNSYYLFQYVSIFQHLCIMFTYIYSSFHQQLQSGRTNWCDSASGTASVWSPSTAPGFVSRQSICSPKVWRQKRLDVETVEEFWRVTLNKYHQAPTDLAEDHCQAFLHALESVGTG